MAEKGKAEETAEATPAEEPKKKKDGKGKDDKKDEKKGPRPKAVKEHKPEFRWIVRLAETDINGERPVWLAIADVRGIGIRSAMLVADHAGIPRKVQIGDLSEAEVDKIKNSLEQFSEYAPPWMLNRQNDIFTGADMMIFGNDLQINIREDINLMKKMRCYKGVRHETGQKVRGQRTKSNGRTGLTVGVTKKTMQAAAAAAKAAEGGDKKDKKDKKDGAAAAPAAAAPAAAPAPKKEEKKPEKK